MRVQMTLLCNHTQESDANPLVPLYSCFQRAKRCMPVHRAHGVGQKMGLRKRVGLPRRKNGASVEDTAGTTGSRRNGATPQSGTYEPSLVVHTARNWRSCIECPPHTQAALRFHGVWV